MATQSQAHTSSSSSGALNHPLVASQYRVDKKIGEGSFGVVFQGLYLQLFICFDVVLIDQLSQAKMSEHEGLSQSNLYGKRLAY